MTSSNELLNYFKQDELASDVWKGKYALPNENTPDDMHKRMAHEFSIIRAKKDPTKTQLEHFETIYASFKSFGYIIPQGSVMAMLGNKDKIGSLSNCLRGDVKVLTRDGFFPIKDLVGKTVEIMTKGGEWVYAPFKNYGQQKLHKLTLVGSIGNEERKTITKELHCTIDHNWFVFDKESSDVTYKLTKSSCLKQGDILYGIAPTKSRVLSKWVVQSFEETDIVEDVFCAEVPVTHSFVIEGNILSGNCFVIGEVPDSYGGIMQKDEELVQLMKRRGGVGVDISSLRPTGSKVNNAAKTSTGAISYMSRFSNSTREVAQDGRRGALMLTIDVRHPDVFEFASIKKDLTKVTGANITIKLRDEFLVAVNQNEDYLLRFPINMDISEVDVENIEYNTLLPYKEGQIKRIRAVDLWSSITENAHAMAEPGVFFLDRHWDYSPDGVYEEYKGITSNPCGEIFMQEYDACRLILLNLYNFVIDKFQDSATFDYEKFYDHAYLMQLLADDLVDLEIHHINTILDKIASDPEPQETKYHETNLWKKILKVATSGRRTGSGITALGDTIAALGLKYDSEESMEVIEHIMDMKFRAELSATIDMAEKQGAFNGFSSEKEFYFDGTGEIIGGKNSFYQFIFENYRPLAERMAKYGRRNVSWSTVAPAGSVSICSQTTSGIEPLFMEYYTRRKKINPSENLRVDFVDQSGDSWQEFPVFHRPILTWAAAQGISEAEITGMDKQSLDALLEKSPWHQSTANDIDWLNRVKIQGIVQKYITHSISSTLNLPNKVTVQKCREIYMRAWGEGLKGITIYRDGCRTGVLVSNETKSGNEITYNDAAKRPKQLDCNIHRLTALGQKWVVFIGMLNNKPFELFAIPNEDLSISGSCEKGQIIKEAKGVYSIKCDDEKITDISSFMRSDDERSDTRMFSLMLRHGVNPKFIISQIEKSAGVVTSFNKAIARTLKKYVAPEDLKSKCTACGSDNIRIEAGCSTCLDCGDSKCG